MMLFPTVPSTNKINLVNGEKSVWTVAVIDREMLSESPEVVKNLLFPRTHAAEEAMPGTSCCQYSPRVV